MFIITAKLNKKKVLLAAVLVVAFLIGLIAAMGHLLGGDGDGALKSEKLATNEEKVAYLEALGWQVDPNASEISQVQIPETFDEIYIAYNELQKSQGFDLEPYQGEQLQLYRYPVLNHPSGEEGVTANLLFDQDRVVGGDISSAQLDGFIHGLNEWPTATTPQTGEEPQSQTDGQQTPESGVQQETPAEDGGLEQQTGAVGQGEIYYVDVEE